MKLEFKGFTALLGLVFLLGNFPAAFSSTEYSAYSSTAITQPTSILRFAEVTPDLYRGARPQYQGVKELAQMGMNTIINIDDYQPELDKEKKYADQMGIKTIGNPMDAFSRPTDKQVNDILKAMLDSQNYPLFLHCRHGQDRTGLMFGLYRVEVQKWTPEAAYKEMIALGFHPALKELDRYYRDRTGYRGP